MEAGNNTEINTEAQPTEATEEPGKLSRIDALEVGLKTQEDKSNVQGEPRATTSSDPGADNRATDDARRADATSGSNKPPTETIEPPAEWSKEEKAEFFKMDAAGRSAALRISKSQQHYHSRKLDEIRASEEKIKQDREQLEWARKLADQVEPFVKTRGDKRPTYEQIVDALKLVNEFDANPEQAAADILRAKGLTPPADWEKGRATQSDEIKPVLDKVTALEQKLAQAEMIQTAKVFSDIGSELQSAKNAAGSPRFPDFNDTESGIRLAGQMGSLIRGEHEHSAGFTAYVKARVPEAANNPVKLCEEAYKWFGGRVDESTEAARSPSPQQHLIKSNRAASSVPGRGLNGASTGAAVKKMDRLSALKKAAELYKN